MEPSPAPRDAPSPDYSVSGRHGRGDGAVGLAASNDRVTPFVVDCTGQTRLYRGADLLWRYVMKPKYK